MKKHLFNLIAPAILLSACGAAPKEPIFTTFLSPDPNAGTAIKQLPGALDSHPAFQNFLQDLNQSMQNGSSSTNGNVAGAALSTYNGAYRFQDGRWTMQLRDSGPVMRGVIKGAVNQPDFLSLVIYAKLGPSYGIGMGRQKASGISDRCEQSAYVEWQGDPGGASITYTIKRSAGLGPDGCPRTTDFKGGTMYRVGGR